LQKAKKALGQLAAEQAKLNAANRRLENQLEELKSKKRKTKITIDPNTLFAHVDRIKQALEEVSKAKVLAEARKPQQIATKATTLGQREEEELRTASDKLTKAKIESYMFQLLEYSRRQRNT
jgi:hypothetical protein